LRKVENWEYSSQIVNSQYYKIVIKKLIASFYTLVLMYPPLLVVMVLYPYVVGLCIDAELVSSREFVILAAWIPLLTIPILLLKNKNVYRLVIWLFFIGSLLSSIHWLILKGPFSVISLFVLLNTNYHEGIEFMQLKLSVRLFWLIPLIALLVFCLKYIPRKKTEQPNKIILTIVGLYAIIFIGENAFNDRLLRKGMPQVTKTLVSYFEEMKMFGSVESRKPIHVNVTTDTEKDQVFVLIIGESCNRNHMSLYGYKHKTNPKLEARNDIVVYKDVISAYSFTLKSVLSMLTESNIETPKPLDQSISLIDVFRSANYQTYWISNQSPLGIWDNAISNLVGSANTVEYVNTVCNSSEDAMYIPSYDAKLFQPFQDALQKKEKRKFIVLHLMGNHSYYAKRYPAEFAFFHSGSTKEEIEINEYDNAILYNDFIVDSLLNMVNTYVKGNPQASSSVIYVSDHGENVYDEYGYAGHDFSNKLPNANIEVPFVVWMSPEFKRINPELSNRVVQNTLVPFMTDDIFHAIVNLNGIECAQLQKERSLFAPSFNAARIRTPENKGPYVRRQ
jgi:heptose-I-phosphate ethanolaminephosphotransferase